MRDARDPGHNNYPSIELIREQQRDAEEDCKHDDCQADRDFCCDCCEGDLYKSPDQYEILYDR